MSLEEQRERVSQICLALPEAAVGARTGQHLAFEVRGKKFAYFLVDHHGDGRVAVNCKAAPGVQEALVAADPQRYFVPAYLGARGWVGIDLDAPGTGWAEVAELLRESYRLVAPKRLASRVAPSGFATG
jgi:hypothetical protein